MNTSRWTLSYIAADIIGRSLALACLAAVVLWLFIGDIGMTLFASYAVFIGHALGRLWGWVRHLRGALDASR
jgi:hypothetical protein